MRTSRASAERRSASSGLMPRRRAASATARYIAPVSKKRYPRRSATSAPIVLFPAPAGPSIATVRGVAFFERNAAPERGDRGGRHGTDDTHLVLALVPVSRMQHPLRPRTVVGEQHEALGVLVEPTDRVKALARAKYLDDGRAPVVVVRGRNDPAGLVEHDIAVRGGRRDRAAIDFDVGIGRDLAAHLTNDLAADAHAALAHELLGRATRRHPAVGEDLLQPDHPGWLGAALRAPLPRGPQPLRHAPGTRAPSGLSARGSSSRLWRPKHSRNSHVVPYRMGRPGVSLRPRSSMSRREASV